MQSGSGSDGLVGLDPEFYTCHTCNVPRLLYQPTPIAVAADPAATQLVEAVINILELNNDQDDLIKVCFLLLFLYQRLSYRRRLFNGRVPTRRHFRMVEFS